MLISNGIPTICGYEMSVRREKRKEGREGERRREQEMTTYGEENMRVLNLIVDLDLATKGDILMHLMSGLEWRAYRRQFEYMLLLLKDIACSKNQNMRNGEGERGSAEVIVGQR